MSAINLEEKISDFLFKELDYVYCFNCKYNDDNTRFSSEPDSDWTYDHCEGCYRKNINWEISKNECYRLAHKILEMVDFLEGTDFS